VQSVGDRGVVWGGGGRIFKKTYFYEI